jgi:hypothetical protein
VNSNSDSCQQKVIRAGVITIILLVIAGALWKRYQIYRQNQRNIDVNEAAANIMYSRVWNENDEEGRFESSQQPKQYVPAHDVVVESNSLVELTPIPTAQVIRRL